MTYPEPIEQAPKISEDIQPQPNRLLEELPKTNFVIPRLTGTGADGNLPVIELHADTDNHDLQNSDTTGDDEPAPTAQIKLATVAGLTAGAMNALMRPQAAVAGEAAAAGVKAALANPGDAFGTVTGAIAGAAAVAAAEAATGKAGAHNQNNQTITTAVQAIAEAAKKQNRK